jgi:hypothetical protein
MTPVHFNSPTGCSTLASRRPPHSGAPETGRDIGGAGKMDLQAKVAAFCRELDDSSLAEIAVRQGMKPTLEHATELLGSGQIGPDLEAALDSLDQMMRQSEGLGLYPPAVRTYQPVPDPVRQSGAQWWTCPRGQCTGRGRVQPGQQPPVCLAAGEPLAPGPFPG